METLYVITTNQCNMNCPFCYTKFVPNFDNPKFNIENPTNHIHPNYLIKLINNGWKTTKNGIKYFDNIVFHGGEPLLYPKVLLEVMDNITRTNIHYCIQSNLAFKDLSKDQMNLLIRLNTYGTSYSLDRFKNNKEKEKYFIKNCIELNEIGLEGSLLVTITEDQINYQRAEYLWEYIEKLNMKYIILERPIYPIRLIEKNKSYYENLYNKIDEYLLQCCKIMPKEKLNLPFLVDNTSKYGCTLYPTKCSKFTYTYYETKGNPKIKLGCPSLENINYNDKEKLVKCISCDYFKYCKGDCECMTNICTFPKKTFSYLQSIEQINKKE